MNASTTVDNFKQTMYNHMMKAITFIFLLSLFFISCRDADSNKATKDSTTGLNQVPDGQFRRTQLIKALKGMGRNFENKDSEAIASLFIFPIADSLLPIYNDDSLFAREYRSNGDALTRSVFISRFHQLYAGLGWDEMSRLFQSINLDSLDRQSELSTEKKIKAEPCMKMYALRAENDTVTITVGTNHNPDYVNPKKKAGEEDDSWEGCEFASIWLFHFDGRRLLFIRKFDAG